MTRTYIALLAAHYLDGADIRKALKTGFIYQKKMLRQPVTFPYSESSCIFTYFERTSGLLAQRQTFGPQ